MWYSLLTENNPFVVHRHIKRSLGWSGLKGMLQMVQASFAVNIVEINVVFQLLVSMSMSSLTFASLGNKLLGD
jgi:hypothetical protein